MKIYKSTHEGAVSYGEGDAVVHLTKGQEFDEGTDIVVAHPEFFEEAGEKVQISEKVQVDGTVTDRDGTPVDGAPTTDDGTVLTADTPVEVRDGVPLVTDSIPSKPTKSTKITDTSK